MPEITSFDIPESIKAEHEAIHAALVRAIEAPGETGVAAKKLASVLHPHFVREEQIALPPLGVLEQLASGANVSKDARTDILKMTDALKAELPKMLEEHEAIRKAVQELLDAATAEDAHDAIELATELAAHAKNEEQIMYPAAVLVGEVIRSREKGG
jgi:hypothetical protein